jgi:hypothetical protein
MHAHAILHTRQAEPPKQIKSLLMPFHLKNIHCGVDPQLLRFDLSSVTECLVIVLLEVDVYALRQCFGTERRNNSRKDQRTRSSLQQLCSSKSKATSPLDTYGSVLSPAFSPSPSAVRSWPRSWRLEASVWSEAKENTSQLGSTQESPCQLVLSLALSLTFRPLR